MATLAENAGDGKGLMIRCEIVRAHPHLELVGLSLHVSNKLRGLSFLRVDTFTSLYKFCSMSLSE